MGGIFKKENGPNLTQYQEVIKLLKFSQVVIFPVDVSVMMEKEDIYHEFYNTLLMSSLITQNFDNSMQRLVIIALTKCEKYLKNREKASEMIKKFKNIHESMIKSLNFFNSNIIWSIVPVKTIGGITYRRTEGQGKETIFVYGPDDENSSDDKKNRYKPENADLIFYLTCAFLLRQAYANRGPFDYAISWLINIIFGGETEFKNTINKTIDWIENRKNNNVSYKTIEMFGKLDLLNKV